jgi:HK97 family phage prohead protease
MTTEVERRFTPGNVELVRAAADRKAIGGYAAKFGKKSRNLGGFVENIAPGAFNASRGDGWPDVAARYNHDDMWTLGTTAAGTLRLSVDDIGLFYEVDINQDDQFAMTVHSRVARGDVAKSSFAFQVVTNGDEWGLTDLDIPLRTLTDVRLHDVAPVNKPAYLDTDTGLRSLANAMGADILEVRKLAEANELRKFFKRTDSGGVPAATYGAAARMALLGRRTDPLA